MLDAAAREDLQHTAYHDGNVMQQIGALLLELGRATLNLRMGQSPVSFPILTRVFVSLEERLPHWRASGRASGQFGAWTVLRLVEVSE